MSYMVRWWCDHCLYQISTELNFRHPDLVMTLRLLYDVIDYMPSMTHMWCPQFTHGYKHISGKYVFVPVLEIYGMFSVAFIQSLKTWNTTSISINELKHTSILTAVIHMPGSHKVLPSKASWIQVFNRVLLFNPSLLPYCALWLGQA